ncbi:hypothetical protein E8E14_006543 [Neopestalotiopsis sp. 37M]|nr:hypothetical protein E8E14_006543 [Neopestalotiopsis sp. 37M]
MTRNSRRPPQSIFFADVIDPEGQRFEVQISDDTGTPDNWIHPYFIDEYGLTCKDLPRPIAYEDASGNHLEANRSVDLEWFGENNRKFKSTFYVMPRRVKIPRLILGLTFVEDYGRAKHVCRSELRVQDAKILTQSPITAREATEIQANGARADAEAARLETARVSTSSRRTHNTSTSSRRTHNTSTRHNRTSGTRNTRTVREDIQNDNPTDDYNNTYDSSGISWGPWARRTNGQWHREGQDSSGNWYQEDRSEDPSVTHNDTYGNNSHNNNDNNNNNPYINNDTHDIINWGSWRRLPNGIWHREGQDSSGQWYEENQPEDPH